MGEGLYRIRIPGQNGNVYMDVSKNSGTPKSSILIGFSIITHPFWGTPYFRKHPYNGDDKSSLKKTPSRLQNHFSCWFWDTHCYFAPRQMRCIACRTPANLVLKLSAQPSPLAFPANLEYNVHVWPCSSGDFFFELNESK